MEDELSPVETVTQADLHDDKYVLIVNIKKVWYLLCFTQVKGTAGFVSLRMKMIAQPCGFSLANVEEQQDGYMNRVSNVGLTKNRKGIR